MKKKVIISSLFFSMCFCMFGQQGNNVFLIRSYNKSLSISIDDNRNFSNFVFDTYGKIVISENNLLDNSHYLFCSQEWDEQLGLYFFPSRTYDPIAKRFQQTDPKSQYHSPYVFVGSDPVNYIDTDGNEGKPLILYQEDHSLTSNKSLSMMDLSSDVKNAHYVPLSDFVNGKVGDLPEWNGNVFIKGHMDVNDGIEIFAENAPSHNMIKMKASKGKFFRGGDGSSKTVLDAEELGGTLRRFSEERGVPIKNIFAGGCQGECAAERIGRGYSEAGSRVMNRELNTYGMKQDFNAVIAGKKSTESSDYLGFKSTRYHVNHKDIYNEPNVEGEFPNAKLKSIDGARFNGFDKNGEEIFEENKPLPFFEGEELDAFVNSRIPSQFESFYSKFKISY